MRIALYQPDIPQNAGAVIRLAACLGVPVDIIEPCGFFMSDRHFRRAGMDYLTHAEVTRHRSWQRFVDGLDARLVLLTTQARMAHTELGYRPDDILLAGRESDGVPPEVHRAAGARVRIPMRPGLRSINVAMALAMVAGEALRQTDAFPHDAVVEISA